MKKLDERTTASEILEAAQMYATEATATKATSAK
jgi:hypothetical protein